MDEHLAQRKGRTLGRVGLMMTMWLDPDASQRQAWQAVIQVAAAYREWSGLDRTGWWSSSTVDETSWFSTLGLNSADPGLSTDAADALLDALQDARGRPIDFLALARAPGPESGLLEVAMGSGPANESAWTAPLPWMLYANVPPDGAGVAGYLRIHAEAGAVNADGFLEDEEAAAFGSFVRAAISVLPVLHGTAGFALQLPLSFRHFRMNMFDAVALYPLVERFKGLDIYDPAEHALALTNASYTVNWISAVGGSLLGKHPQPQDTGLQAQGGMELQRTQHALIVQAGASPCLLDTSIPQSERSVAADAAYVQAAQRLRPWRIAAADNECIAPPPYGFANEYAWRAACERYLARFDAAVPRRGK